jgi:hypothetical protein
VCRISGGRNLPTAPEAGRESDRVVCDLHHALFDKEGERDFRVAARDLLLEIERRHELAEHRSGDQSVYVTTRCQMRRRLYRAIVGRCVCQPWARW